LLSAVPEATTIGNQTSTWMKAVEGALKVLKKEKQQTVDAILGENWSGSAYVVAWVRA
jgi:hypothetical protein